MSLDASIRSEFGGIEISSGDPISAIVAPSISSRPGDSFSKGVNKVPASIATTSLSLTTASQVTEYLPQVAVRIDGMLLRVFAVAPKHTHDDGQFKVGS